MFSVRNKLHRFAFKGYKKLISWILEDFKNIEYCIALQYTYDIIISKY